MTTPKIVKRYANRKLYDTERSCYVTLDDISSMIKAGDEVRVIDNKSGEDLTSVTLAQIIFEAEKKNSFMPLSLLRNLIQQGEHAIEDARERVVGSVQAKAEEFRTTAQKLRSGFEDRIGGVMSRKDGEEGHDSTGEGGEVSGERHAHKPRLVELYVSSQRALEDLQHGVEERVKAMGNIARYASLGHEMDEIRKRLAELEDRLGGISQ